VEGTAGGVTTRAGLRRIQEQGEDTYVAGTQHPRTFGWTVRDDGDDGQDEATGQDDDTDNTRGDDGESEDRPVDLSSLIASYFGRK
jgi:hypothetical protein